MGHGLHRAKRLPRRHLRLSIWFAGHRRKLAAEAARLAKVSYWVPEMSDAEGYMALVPLPRPAISLAGRIALQSGDSALADRARTPNIALRHGGRSGQPCC